MRQVRPPGPVRANLRFGALRPGQQFRTLDEHGRPIMTVLYTRISDTMYRGRRHNALGWSTQTDAGRGRHYCFFAPSTPVALDTFNLPADPSDDEWEFLPDSGEFDPAATPAPPLGIFDPNLDDLW